MPIQRVPGIAKIHGGKSHLAPLLFAHLGYKYTKFVDMFGGMGSMSKQAQKVAHCKILYNDLDPHKVNLMRVVKHDPHALVAALQATQYSEKSLETAKAALKSELLPLEAAVATFIRHQMSRGGVGDTFAWSDRLRRGLPGDVSAWFSAIARIPHESALMAHWELSNREGIDAFFGHGPNDALYYADPPYLHETRVSTGEYGEFEMNFDDHCELLHTLTYWPDLRIAISGYRSKLYDEYLKAWKRVDIQTSSQSGHGREKKPRTECLWLSPGQQRRR